MPQAAASASSIARIFDPVPPPPGLSAPSSAAPPPAPAMLTPAPPPAEIAAPPAFPSASSTSIRQPPPPAGTTAAPPVYRPITPGANPFTGAPLPPPQHFDNYLGPAGRPPVPPTGTLLTDDLMAGAGAASAAAPVSVSHPIFASHHHAAGAGVLADSGELPVGAPAYPGSTTDYGADRPPPPPAAKQAPFGGPQRAWNGMPAPQQQQPQQPQDWSGAARAQGWSATDRAAIPAAASTMVALPVAGGPDDAPSPARPQLGVHAPPSHQAHPQQLGSWGFLPTTPAHGTPKKAGQTAKVGTLFASRAAQGSGHMNNYS